MPDNKELFDLIEQIEDIPNEGARIPLTEEAIRLADQLNERYFSFDLRMDLVRYGVFHGQVMKSIPAFSWCMAEIENNPDCEFEMDDILWEYKWINNYLTDFHEIPVSKIDEMNEDFKQKLKENGYGLNTFHYMMMNRGISMNDLDFAKTHYGEMLKYGRDDMSDCKACVQDGIVYYAITIGDYEMAMEKAKPILSGKMSCAEVPHYTYGNLLIPVFMHGDTEMAAVMEKKGYRLIYKNQEFLGVIGDFLLYYAFTDPKKAVERYPKFVPWSFDPYTTHFKKWNFAASAAAMFTKLINSGIKEAKFILPKEHPLYNEAGQYGLKALADYHYKVASEIGGKLDKRNGNTGFMDRLKQRLAWAE